MLMIQIKTLKKFPTTYFSGGDPTGHRSNDGFWSLGNPLPHTGSHLEEEKKIKKRTSPSHRFTPRKIEIRKKHHTNFISISFTINS